MKALLEKKYITSGFLVALIILLVINYLSYKNINDHFEDERYISDAVKTIRLCEKLLTYLNEASAGRRGYLITANEEFLAQYYASISMVDTVFSQLRNRPANNLKEKAIIDTLAFLILMRKDLFEEAIELQDKKVKSGKQQTELTEKGRETHEKIKYYIQQIENEENAILTVRNSQLVQSANFTIINMVFGTGISFILLIIGFVLLSREISYRRRYEVDLKESRNWFLTTLRSIGDAVIVTNRFGDIEFMNPVAESLTGWEIENAKGKGIDRVFKIIDENTKERIESPINKVMREGKIAGLSNHSILVNYHGREIPIDDSAAPVIDDKNKILGVVLIFRDITARRKAEIELVGSQRFIQSIADSIPNILYLYDLKGPSIKYSNGQIAEKLGYTPEHVRSMGREFFEKCMHPDDYVKLTDLFKKYIKAKDNEILENEYRLKNANGEWRWFQSRDVVFKRSSDGVPIQMLGTSLDITERKKLEEELKHHYERLEEIVGERTAELRLINERLQQEILERIKAEKAIVEAEIKFRSLVESALVGIYIVQDNQFVYANPKFEEIFGYTHNELNGRSIKEILTEENLSLVFENIRRRLEGEVENVQYSYRAKCKDGSLVDVEVRGTTMEYRGKIAIIGTLMDITERVRAEEAIKNHERFLKTVIDANPNLIFVKDGIGKFTIVNKAFAEFYGVTEEKMIGKTDADFIENIEEVENYKMDDEAVLTTQKSVLIPELSGKDLRIGEHRWFQVNKSPLVLHDGTLHVLGVAVDITERKKAEDDIRKSLKEKELLLQEIHHRVKNNLQIIVSLFKLQSKFIHDKRDLEIFNKSRARAETMALIHENLYRTSDLANIEIGNYVRNLTRHLLLVYGASRDEVTISVMSDNVKLGIDTAIPCGLLINELVSNSLKYAFPDLKLEGKKTTKSKSSEGKDYRISIEVKETGGRIELRVSDNGIGLPDGLDFNNSQSLGMQLIGTLTRQLEGKMELVSDKGTTYIFTFSELKYSQRY